MSTTQNIIKKAILIFLTLSFCLAEVVDQNWDSQSYLQIEDDITDEEENNLCLKYLPFDLDEDLESQYNLWYGLLGKNIRGNTFQTGHALQRHIAIDGKCTQAQTRQHKTVFYDIYEFLMAAQKIPALCSINMANHKKFTFDYNGQFTDPEDFIIGIDCKTGEIQIFYEYFVEFKRAVQNPSPTHEDYLQSNYVTLWTFYPKRY